MVRNASKLCVAVIAGCGLWLTSTASSCGSGVMNQSNDGGSALAQKTIESLSVNNFTVRWGTTNKREYPASGWQTMNDSLLVAISKADSNSPFSISRAFAVPREFVQRIRVMTKDTLLKYQTVTIPSDTICFVEYKSAKTDAYFRAMWNPTHLLNVGSVGFRRLYDSLGRMTTPFDSPPAK